MSEKDTSRIIIDNPRVRLLIVASLTVDSRGIIHYRNMLMVLATDSCILGLFGWLERDRFVEYLKSDLSMAIYNSVAQHWSSR
jgi:hypothetical protein